MEKQDFFEGGAGNWGRWGHWILLKHGDFPSLLLCWSFGGCSSSKALEDGDGDYGDNWDIGEMERVLKLTRSVSKIDTLRVKVFENKVLPSFINY